MVKAVFIGVVALGIVLLIGWYISKRPIAIYSTIGKNSYTAYELTPGELSNLEKKAETGDADAAMRIFYYYGQARGDRKEAVRWLRRSRALGDKNADSILKDVYKESD